MKSGPKGAGGGACFDPSLGVGAAVGFVGSDTCPVGGAGHVIVVMVSEKGPCQLDLRHLLSWNHAEVNLDFLGLDGTHSVDHKGWKHCCTAH